MMKLTLTALTVAANMFAKQFFKRFMVRFASGAFVLICSFTQAQAKGLLDYLPNFLRSDEAVFVSNCEEVFKERLKSPSTYSRISYSFSEKVASPIEAAGLDFEENEVYKQAFLKFKNDVNGYEKSLAAKATTSISKTMASINVTSYEIYLSKYNSCQKSKCPTRATALIKAEAANAFGVPIANTFVCQVNYFDELKTSTSGLHVNGQTNFGYMLNPLKK